MHIAVAATPAVALPTLDWLVASAHDLDLIITRPDRPAGRGRSLRESQVGFWADAHEIRCIKPSKSDELAQPLKIIDLVVTIGYGVILPRGILSIPRHGFINLHFSLLPAWRGAAPVQCAILHGDPNIGLTVFALDEGMDTGPIYLQKAVPNEPHENSGECLERMALLGPELLRDSIDLIEKGFSPVRQGEMGVSYAPKITKEDARIRWDGDVIGIDRHIRAFTPEPGAWTTWRGEPLRVVRARPYLSDDRLHRGEIAIKNGNVLVGCGTGDAIVLEEVTPSGKKTMSAKSWSNGARAIPGESFV
ncbi:MAG: methionyl-tRNA formyltransferase [Actinobacteria bacterium]|nr:methionyl-tRNA formyltransferase [Actinomycetota bacterium]